MTNSIDLYHVRHRIMRYVFEEDLHVQTDAHALVRKTRQRVNSSAWCSVSVQSFVLWPIAARKPCRI